MVLTIIVRNPKPETGIRIDIRIPSPQVRLGIVSQRGPGQPGKQMKAHSFPPSSLGRRSTDLIVSPKKVVGCKGGSRYVEGSLFEK